MSDNIIDINDHNKILEELKKQNPRKLNTDWKQATGYISPNGNTDSTYIEAIKSSQIESKEHPWLWDNIIPLNSTTLFAGLPGVGKSQLLTFLAATISNGTTFKCGGAIHSIVQGSVLILSAEDDFEYTLTPRLIAANANLEKVYLLKCSVGVISGNRKLIDLTIQLNLLEEKIKELGDVKCIIIDPVNLFIGNLKDHVASEVNNFINDLNELAKKYNLSIIINKHLRKHASGSGATDALSEVSGSGSWVSAPRQSWVICRDHDDEEKILMVNLKVNIARRTKQAFVYSIIQNNIKVGDKIITSTSLQWSDQIQNISADDAVMNGEGYNKSINNKCVDFIYKYLLKNGQSLSSNIKAAAEKEGFKDSTYRYALENFKKLYKDILDIKSSLQGRQKMYMLK